MGKDIARSVWFDTGQVKNVFARARRVIDLSSRPERAEIRIATSGLYRLWINGRPAGRGPALSGADKRRYDILDVAEFLVEGVNVLALSLTHFELGTALSPKGDGALWVELECDGEVVTSSDTGWRFSVDLSFDPLATLRNNAYGPLEVYDTRREDNWRDADYDDSQWQSAVPCLDLHGRLPWDELIPRGVPQCFEEDLTPQSVVRVGEVLAQEFSPTMWGRMAVQSLAVYLMQDVIEETRLTSIDNAEALIVSGEGVTTITQPSPTDHSQPEQFCATIVLDFGREIDAYGWIDVEGNAGAMVDVAYGEQLTGGRVQAVRQSTHYADRLILREGRQRHEVYDWKGYRYVQLTFRDLTRPLIVHGVGATFTSYPYEPNGRFECSDDVVSRTWQVGAYTQQLCTQGHMMDCPWREQQQWLGDGRVQLLIIQNAFGDRAITRKFIEDFADSQFDDGLLPAISFKRNCIFDYALWWIQGIKDVCLFNGDLSLARAVLPRLIRLLDGVALSENGDGLLEDTPYHAFIDWANVGKTGCCAPMNAIYVIALNAAADTAAQIGEGDIAAQCRGKAQRIADVFHDKFWNEERGLYVDNIVDGAQTDYFSQHTQSITVLAGLTRVNDNALLRKTVDDDSLVQTEPYFSFYLVEALAQSGLADVALDYLRRRWGKMLDGGATTFWEEWQVDGTYRAGRWTPRPRSHCHAWSAAPTAWLSRHVLGVRVEEYNGPVIVEPNHCGLEQANGIVPTRDGDIRVEWQVEGDRLVGTIEAPSGVEIDLREPAGYEGKMEFAIV